MSGKFWAMLVDFKIAERYYWHYIIDSKKWNNIISGVCLLTTATSISAWFIWTQVPILWAVFICAAQVVTVLKPLMPFSERLIAARYIVQDLTKLLIVVESEWGCDGSGVSDDDYKKLISEFETRFADSEGRFSTPDMFPQNLKLHDKAQRDATMYIESRYNVKGDVPA